jgi:hypothetical protein
MLHIEEFRSRGLHLPLLRLQVLLGELLGYPLLPESRIIHMIGRPELLDNFSRRKFHDIWDLDFVLPAIYDFRRSLRRL